MRLNTALLGVFLGVLAVAPARAQAPVTGAADPESLFTSPDPKLHANKQVVLHIVRDLLEANHWELADKYLTKEYIQHNPNVASGLDPVLKFFGSRTPTPIPDRRSWKNKDPRDPNKTYTTTWFDMWRIKDGKADEHWDPATIAAPPSR